MGKPQHELVHGTDTVITEINEKSTTLTRFFMSRGYGNHVCQQQDPSIVVKTVFQYMCQLAVAMATGTLTDI